MSDSLPVKRLEGAFESGGGPWLVTGAAGFIGSHLVEHLLKLDQKVIGLDNFSTGHPKNLQQVEELVGSDRWKRFSLIEGDIRDLSVCIAACRGTRYVLHQAALGSVPRSIQDPLGVHATNITGFLNVLESARQAQVDSFVFAASSSTYGDNAELPKIEERIGRPLSPYAVTKLVNELYAEVYSRVYGFRSIGLRYFNVFGPRQDPDGAYAAVIPLWFKALVSGGSVFINGDGETGRDFCFVENVVQANLLAALSQDPESWGQIYNVAFGESTTLNQLFALIVERLRSLDIEPSIGEPAYRDFRQGDIRHSLADISKASRLLGYAPEYSVRLGLEKAADWYVQSILGSRV